MQACDVDFNSVIPLLGQDERARIKIKYPVFVHKLYTVEYGSWNNPVCSTVKLMYPRKINIVHIITKKISELVWIIFQSRIILITSLFCARKLKWIQEHSGHECYRSISACAILFACKVDKLGQCEIFESVQRHNWLEFDWLQIYCSSEPRENLENCGHLITRRNQ